MSIDLDLSHFRYNGNNGNNRYDQSPQTRGYNRGSNNNDNRNGNNNENRGDNGNERNPYPRNHNNNRSDRNDKYQRQDRRRKISEGDHSSDAEGDNDSSGPCKEGKRRARSYFIMKCNNEKNMQISFDRNIWATTKSNEKRLNRAFSISDQVFLIFSIQGSGHFQGVGKMTSAISDKFCEDFGSTNLGGVFDVEWLYKEEIPFQFTQHLTNPWNDNKKVQISRDAQEVEPVVGADLVLLWESANEPAAKESSGHNVRDSSDLISPDGSSVQESEPPSEFYPDEVYPSEADGSGGGGYMEGYPMYNPPSYNPQFMPPDYQHCPPHFAAPPPHMAYQQQYPMYAPQPQGDPYRHQEYYPVPPQPPQYAAAPRRDGGGGGGGHEVFRREAAPFTPSRQTVDTEDGRDVAYRN